MKRTTRRRLGGGSAAVLLTGALAFGTVMSSPAASNPLQTFTSPPTPVTVTPDPWYASEPFDGWGTSLVWFANATGGYPEELREELYQALFGEDGLRLNIARYNVGGGHASDVVDYLRPGGAVQGWWRADATGDGAFGVPTTLANREAAKAAFDPDDDAFYDLDADATQRWWVQRLADDGVITHWEAFANSAPWFLTSNGYVSGGTDATAEQLPADAVEKFAAYLVRVVEELEAAHGIDVATVDPLNEPGTDYWRTTLTGGVPTGGRQEGMHVDAARQADLVRALRAAIDASGVDAAVSAMDETDPDKFKGNWGAYDAATRDAVAQLNVHTYSTGGRRVVRDIAKAEDKPLWMSEVEGNWGGAWDPSSMANGLGLSNHIHADLRELEPNAWVFWQPVEDLLNMEPGGEDLNWGGVFVDFDCQEYPTATGTVFASARRVAAAGGDASDVEACRVVTNTKFDTTRNFTHFVRPGDRIIATDSDAATAALSADGTSTSLVWTNATSTAQRLTVDLARFGTVADGATATPYVTTESPADAPGSQALVPGAPVAVDATARSVTLTVPARSVTSVVLDGVSGVAPDAATIVDGDTYQVVGVQSGKALTAGGGSAATTITTPDLSFGTAPQLWTFHEVPSTQRTAARRYVLENGDGRFLAVADTTKYLDGPATTLLDVSLAQAVGRADARWVASTQDGVTFTLANDAVASVLDVAGASSEDGASVGTWISWDYNTNQRWIVRDQVVRGTQHVVTNTVAGTAPALPGTVVPTYRWGTGAPVEVDWQLPSASTWDGPGTVEVRGTVAGADVQALATVEVGGFTVTDPVAVHVVAGATAAQVRDLAPSTVPARIGASSTTFETPVTWDLDALTDGQLVSPGVVTVTGAAQSNDPSAGPVPARLSVVVGAGPGGNIAPTSTATATYTEGSNDPARTIDGDELGTWWSNWKPDNKNAQDTLTYTFPEEVVLESLTITFRADGGKAWAEQIQVEHLDQGGTWRPVAGYASPVPVTGTNGQDPGPAVTVPLGGVTTTAVRVVMHAHDNTHLQVYDVKILPVVVAGTSDLATLRVGGVEVDGFAAGRTGYAATVAGSSYPRIDAFAVDPDADVRITQPSVANGGAGTVVVRGVGGAEPRTYTVDVSRDAVVHGVAVAGVVRAGRTVTAVASTDPAGAEVTVTWLLDGDVLGTGTSIGLPPDAAGAELVARASAAAPGFGASATVDSPAVVVEAASSDVTLQTLTLDGVTVDGFTGTRTAYVVVVPGSAWPALGAEATDPAASVTVVQPAAADGSGTVTVTAEDGTTRTVTVTVQRQVAVTSVSLTGEAAVGAEVAAAVTVDPGGATLTYAWSVDGHVVPGATGATYRPTAADAGRPLTVSVVAQASGYLQSQARTSAAVTVGAEDGPTPTHTASPTAGPTASPTAAPTASSSTPRLSVSTVAAGGTVGVTAEGLTPGGEVAVELHSTPVLLAVLRADAAGAIDTVVTVPASTPVGTHTVVVVDRTTGATQSAPIRVTAAGGRLAVTGPATTGALLLVSVLLIGAGVTAVTAHRRRREG